MRNVLQLGLCTGAEWAYLALDNWQEIIDSDELRSKYYLRNEHRLPDFYRNDPTPFRYYGVDVSPASITHIREAYKTFPNCYFIAVGVSNDFLVGNTPNRYYDEQHSSWYEFLHERDNTCFLFVPFSFLLNNLDIEHLTVLALDIDGYEKDVLSTIYNWKIFPEFITIETSLKYPEFYEKTLEEVGYTYIRVFPQYSREEVEQVGNESDAEMIWSMHEQQFLRNDIYEANKESIKIEHIYRGGQDEMVRNDAE